MRFPLIGLLPSLVLIATSDRTSAAPPDYNRDVRPILSNACFKCHGPGTAKSGVRLDSAELAQKKSAIVPGKPHESSILERIVATDEGEVMPPPESGPRLTADQVQILRDWIAAGAPYAPHWAFVAPKRPTVHNAGEVHRGSQAIDRLLAARRNGLPPSPRATPATLLRRVSLDLTGLLPTPAEVAAFEQATRHDPVTAYRQAVDRLLASPHYGERQARHWLDLARYADSNGYTIDGVRSIWPYRDWVITAFNKDMPFDQFTIEQLAGDLLPNPTQSQLIATGFQRNTPFNEEGGSDPEQFRVERTIDRANTIGAVWLGLTLGCAQCHDHKFDPIRQKDYFQIYAFWDSCEEPTLPVGGDPELAAKLNALDAKARELNTAGKVAEADKVKAEAKKLAGKIPTTLIVRERAKPRTTFVHVRGDFLRAGEAVQPDYPLTLAGISPPTAEPSPARKSRLDLARWLTRPDHPLTPRVTVNRIWGQLFGRGIVATENDFGMQGDAPTHPELLDWLAVEFVESGWSVKQLLRTIVMSEAYQQSSAHRSDVAERDPLNKLLARQNRLRVEAEILRDAALCASGKLTPTIGGPGVFPPQPPEVFSFTQNKKSWPESQGADRFRRGLYTTINRQSQHHLLTTFDGADAQTSCTRRNRSNTPLQALHLANDPVFVELARYLGDRIVAEAPADDLARIRHGMQLVVSRDPTPAEAKLLQQFLQQQQNTDAATAFHQLGRVLLNLDEFVTRE
jgi:hypothetical protein